MINFFKTPCLVTMLTTLLSLPSASRPTVPHLNEETVICMKRFTNKNRWPGDQRQQVCRCNFFKTPCLFATNTF
jgi:hypothetical protein